ncbi:hypothetical protein CR203_09315 [Salipaludibacillus neizhouensis]|uniref:Kynurenine formamidase n=1 Tax=Salipaludibacillus neizhouensis TaxID=885475 RepID=A0A3A9K7R7_9BACI|nr:cyclase family protein [Salipaludibacillus neizhouensis]RKL67538.1 hypothetical protein CR203_09315 [Salipaludibacillus neizhouensis]
MLKDITKTMENGMKVWPGDIHFSYTSLAAIRDGDAVNVGKLEMSTHTGTHLDAPYHYDQDGIGIDEIPLDILCGNCIVIELFNVHTITKDHLTSLNFKGVEKVLFKTTQLKEGHSYQDFPVFSKDSAPFLKEMGVHLIGTDAASVDPLNSKNLEAHHSFKETNIFILEGLELFQVEPGFYHLTALPLKLKGGDGCPVRAILSSI